MLLKDTLGKSLGTRVLHRRRFVILLCRVHVLTYRWFTIVLFRLHVSVRPSPQRIFYRPFQIACKSGSFTTEDFLSSFSDCMWEWVFITEDLLSSVQIARESGSLLTEDLLSFCAECMWEWVPIHRGFAIILLCRVHVRVGPYSQRICYHPSV
jgi:hypothetical protein